MKPRFDRVAAACFSKRKKIASKRSALFWGFAGLASATHGVTIDLPANVELNGSAGLEVQYDDNVSLTAQNRLDDWVTRLSPSIELSREGQVTNLNGRFILTRGHYLNGTRQHFTDYVTDIGWQWRAAPVVELRVSAAYADVAQSITGTLDDGQVPILIEAERTRRPSGEIGIAFGRQGGKLQGLIRSGIRQSEFDDTTRDSTTIYSGISTTYELNSVLLVGMQVVETDLEYKEFTDIPDRDSSETLAMLTTELRMPKTRIELRGGRLHKEFDLNTRQDFDGPRWDARISWSPKTYSTLSFGIGENVQESMGIASFVDVKSKVFSWSHQWSSSFSGTFSHSETEGVFVDADRTDSVLRSSFSIRYLPREWLSVRVGVSRLENRTSAAELGLENNRYYLGLEAPL